MNEAYTLGDSSADMHSAHTAQSLSDFEGDVESEVLSTPLEHFSSQENVQYQNIMN